MRGALTAERGYEKCLASFPEFNAVVRESIADETAAIAHDLQSPGVSVAAIPLRSLVARDGVLARLQAQGYEVQDAGLQLKPATALPPGPTIVT